MACMPRILNDNPEEEEEYIDKELFEQIKEAALLCPVCYDVYKNPVNVK